MKKITFFVLFSFVLLSLVAQKEEKRIALLIGNSDYKQYPLKNSVNDVKFLGLELEKLGFKVIVRTDVLYNEMKKSLKDFSDTVSKIEKAICFFYYAGHGIQSEGQNFLIPTKAKIEAEKDIEFETIQLNQVLKQVCLPSNFLSLVFLDVSPRNPYQQFMGRGAARGLTYVPAPSNTILAYSNTNKNREGLYVEELVKALRTPGLKIHDVFKRIRSNVYNKSNGVQLPWENSSFDGEFYFNLMPIKR